MALKTTPRAAYSFELSPHVAVAPFQTIRGTKDGVDVSLSVAVKPLSKESKVSAPETTERGEVAEFIANIEKDKEYTVGGEKYSVTKVSKKKVVLENKENELTLSPEELYDQAE